MKVEVKFSIEIPDGISRQDAEEWLKYHLCHQGMRCANPLDGRELEVPYHALNIQFPFGQPAAVPVRPANETQVKNLVDLEVPEAYARHMTYDEAKAHLERYGIYV